MNPEEIQQLCREQLGLRIGPAMAEYVADCIGAGASRETIPVIGGNARTGLPLLKEFPLDTFTKEYRP